MLEPLWDDTLVVRGGLMATGPLVDSVRTGMERDGSPNLSFWGENGMTLEEICDEVGDRMPQSKVRYSTVAQVRTFAEDIYRSEPWPHITLRFYGDPTENELEALAGVFSAAVPNPSRQA